MKKAPSNLEISKQEIFEYLNDRLGTKYELIEKISRYQQSPPPSTSKKTHPRMVMTSPKEKSLNSLHNTPLIKQE